MVELVEGPREVASLNSYSTLPRDCLFSQANYEYSYCNRLSTLASMIQQS